MSERKRGYICQQKGCNAFATIGAAHKHGGRWVRARHCNDHGAIYWKWCEPLPGATSFPVSKPLGVFELCE